MRAPIITPTKPFGGKRSGTTLTAALGLALVGLIPRPAQAENRYWNTSNGLWSQSASWNPAIVPGPSDDAVIDFTNGLARVNTTAIGAVSSAYVYNNATVSISNQGSLRCNADFVVARGSGGALNVLTNNPVLAFPGGLNVGNNLRVGVLGHTGRVNQDAGTVVVGNDVVLGESASTFVGTGSYTLGGTGVLQARQLLLGTHAGAAGYMSVGGFARINVEDLRLSFSGDSYGARVTQAGGQVNVSNRLTIDSGMRADGRYTLNGGALTATRTTIYEDGLLEYNGGTASLGELTLSRGDIVLSPHGGKVLRASRLFMDFPSRIELANNSMLLTNEAPDVVGYYILDGYAGGNWNVPYGITSSFAAATALLGLPHRTALGYGAVPEGTLIKYTYVGDATLDGAVNLQDFNRLASNFGGANKVWSDGDFNYDFTVNLQDFNLLASNFGISAAGPEVTPDDWAALAAAVPEPSAAVALTFSFVPLARRARNLPRSARAPRVTTRARGAI